MRDKIKGRAGKIFLFFIFLTFFGGLGISKLVMSLISDSDAVMIINKMPISYDIFRMRVHQEEQKIAGVQAKYGKNTDLALRLMGMSNDPNAIALRTVMYQGILDSFSHAMKLHLSPEYVALKLNDPYFLMLALRQQFPVEEIQNPLAFYQMLKNTPQHKMFEEQLKTDMKNDVAISMMRTGFFIPSFVQEQMSKEITASKKFGIQKFSLSFFVDQAHKAGASAEQLKNFFDQQNAQTKRYWVPEKRTAVQWTFNPKTYGIVVTEDEITDFYAKNKTARFIDAKAQVKVRELVLTLDKKDSQELVLQEARRLQEQAVQNPADFVTLIKKHSTAKVSREKDGIVDFFAKNAGTASEYEKAAFRLKEDGDISPVVQLDDKVVVLQRVARKEATYKPLAKVKDDIVRLLIDQKFKVAFAKNVSPLIHGTDEVALDRFVQEHQGIKTERSVQVRPENPSAIEQKLFGIRKEGNMAAFIDDNKGILLKVTSLERPQPASFKVVKDQVTRDYYEQEGLKALEAAMQESKKAASVAKKLVPAVGATIAVTDWINPDDKKKITELSSEQGYPADFMSLGWIGGSIAGVNKTGGVLLVLEGVQELKNPTSEQKQRFMTTVYQDQNRLYSQGFIASLYRDATIKVNEELVRTIERQP